MKHSSENFQFSFNGFKIHFNDEGGKTPLGLFILN